MGQKLFEHPVVDQWLRYAREADRAGARLSRRKSSDRRELEQFAEMQRRRTRLLVSMPALPDAHPDSALCVKCSKPLSKRDKQRRPTRQVYEAGSREPVTYWRCRKCAGL